MVEVARKEMKSSRNEPRRELPQIHEMYQTENDESSTLDDSKHELRREWLIHTYGEMQDEASGSDASHDSLDSKPPHKQEQNADVDELELIRLETAIQEDEAYFKDEASAYFRSKQETKDLKKKIHDLKIEASKMRGKLAAKSKSKSTVPEGIKEKSDEMLNFEQNSSQIQQVDKFQNEGFVTNEDPDDGEGLADLFNEVKLASTPCDSALQTGVRTNLDPMPKDWTGLLPKQELEKWCMKRKLKKPKYNQGREGNPQQYSLSLNTHPSGKDCFHLNIIGYASYPSFKDAQQYLAAEALYKLNLNNSLHRMFPPCIQDTWLSWIKAAEDIHLAETRMQEQLKIDKLQSLLDKILSQLEEEMEKFKSKKSTFAFTERAFEFSPNKDCEVERKNRHKTSPSKLVFEKQKREFLSSCKSPQYQAMLNERSNLPISNYRAELCKAIASHQVTILCGETGCGKSTQCPQYLLEDLLLSSETTTGSVICTQPRRISAISLAERVADEMCCKVGDLVGYQIRMESKTSTRTRLFFCTTGIIIRRLQEDPNLTGVTHLVVDEVHERQWQIDILLVLLKRLLISTRTDLKVILMSATLDSNLFTNFFENAPLVCVPGRTFPVKEYYLEDILDATGHIIEEGSQCAMRDKANDAEQAKIWIRGSGRTKRREIVSLSVQAAEVDEDEPYFNYKLNTRVSMKRVNEIVLNYDLIEDILSLLLVNPDRNKTLIPPDQSKGHSLENGATLIFLPGIGEIQTLRDRLISSRIFGDSKRFLVLALHSSVSSTEQKKAFETPKSGVRKIILSTNISETSVTIPDVVCVIDTGLVREVRLNKRSNSSMLIKDWCSKASAKQRQGRAGRVQPGLCLKLFSYYTATEVMKDHSAPEIQRTPLEEICLSILASGITNDCGDILSELPEPPPENSVSQSLNLLGKIGACTTISKTSSGIVCKFTQLTALGKYLAKLPLDARLAKMLLFGCFFGCVEKIVTIASGLSSKSPFSLQLDDSQQAKAMHRRFIVPGSDCLTLYNIFHFFVKENRSFRFCRENFLSYSALTEIYETRKYLISLLVDSGFLDKGTNVINIESCQHNLNGNVESLVRVVTCAGLYPNVACITSEKIVQNKEELYIHSSSVGLGNKNKSVESSWIVFNERFETRKAFISSIGPTTPFALLLFSESLIIDYLRRSVMVGDWIKLGASAKTCVLLREIRKEFNKQLEHSLNGNAVSIADDFDEAVNLIVKLIKHEY